MYAIKRQEVAMLLIQNYTRRWLLRRYFLHVRSAALIIQSSIRGYSACKRFVIMMEHRAAIRIQVIFYRKLQMKKQYVPLAAISFA